MLLYSPLTAVPPTAFHRLLLLALQNFPAGEVRERQGDGSLFSIDKAVLPTAFHWIFLLALQNFPAGEVWERQGDNLHALLFFNCDCFLTFQLLADLAKDFPAGKVWAARWTFPQQFNNSHLLLQVVHSTFPCMNFPLRLKSMRDKMTIFRPPCSQSLQLGQTLVVDCSGIIYLPRFLEEKICWTGPSGSILEANLRCACLPLGHLSCLPQICNDGEVEDNSSSSSKVAGEQSDQNMGSYHTVTEFYEQMQHRRVLSNDMT